MTIKLLYFENKLYQCKFNLFLSQFFFWFAAAKSAAPQRYIGFYSFIINKQHLSSTIPAPTILAAVVGTTEILLRSTINKVNTVKQTYRYILRQNERKEMTAYCCPCIAQFPKLIFQQSIFLFKKPTMPTALQEWIEKMYKKSTSIGRMIERTFSGRS